MEKQTDGGSIAKRAVCGYLGGWVSGVREHIEIINDNAHGVRATVHISVPRQHIDKMIEREADELALARTTPAHLRTPMQIKAIERAGDINIGA